MISEEAADHCPSTTPTLQRDDTFYIDTDSVVFQVEDTLFKLSRYPFVKGSQVFAAMFALPQDTSKSTEGRSDAHPIVLPGVSVADFKVFLRLLHPLELYPFIKLGLTSVQDWVPVLRLSKLWAFDTITELAVTEMSRLLNNRESTMDNIFLGREFRVPEWVIRGYTSLIKRKDSLTDEEAAALGWSTAARIFRTREKYERYPRCIRCDGERCKGSLALPANLRCQSCYEYKDVAALRNSIPPEVLPRFVEELFSDELSMLKF